MSVENSGSGKIFKKFGQPSAEGPPPGCFSGGQQLTDFAEIESKWQRMWKEHHVYEADLPNRPKMLSLIHI